MKTYIEITTDNSWKLRVSARNNKAEYVLTSARMHDLYREYIYRYGKIPTAKWYHRHAQFKEKM